MSTVVSSVEITFPNVWTSEPVPKPEGSELEGPSTVASSEDEQGRASQQQGQTITTAANPAQTKSYDVSVPLSVAKNLKVDKVFRGGTGTKTRVTIGDLYADQKRDFLIQFEKQKTMHGLSLDAPRGGPSVVENFPDSLLEGTVKVDFLDLETSQWVAEKSDLKLPLQQAKKSSGPMSVNDFVLYFSPSCGNTWIPVRVVSVAASDGQDEWGGEYKTGFVELDIKLGVFHDPLAADIVKKFPLRAVETQPESQAVASAHARVLVATAMESAKEQADRDRFQDARGIIQTCVNEVRAGENVQFNS